MLASALCVRMFLTAFERAYAEYNEIYLTYFYKGLPASRPAGVTRLTRGGVIEVILMGRWP